MSVPEDPGAIAHGRRPFRLLHLMAMVAAIALTLVISPALMREIMRSYGPASSWNRFMYLDGTITLALALWSSALGPLALVAERPRLREAARSYGTSAALASAAALGFLIITKTVEQVGTWPNSGWQAAWSSRNFWLNLMWRWVDEIPHVEAGAVVATWSVLAISGLGRRPSGWAGLLGLMLGLVWIAWSLGGQFVLLLNLPWLRGGVPSWA